MSSSAFYRCAHRFLISTRPHLRSPISLFRCFLTQPLVRRNGLRLSLVGLLALITACADSPSEVPFGGAPHLPQERTQAQAQAFDEGSCAVWAPDSSGVYRGMVIPRRMLPFNAKAIRNEAGKNTGRAIAIRTYAPDSTPVTMECWLDDSMSPQDIAGALSTSRKGRWKAIFAQLKTARALPDSGQWRVQRPQTQTAQKTSSLSSNMVVAKGQVDETCATVWISFEWYDSDGHWHHVDIEFTICHTGGGSSASGWMIQHGYGQGSYLVLDATKYLIQHTDSVTFFAELVTSSYEFPYVLGWDWTPKPGVNDPWTIACAGTDYTCSRKIHGSGIMTFELMIAGEWLSAEVQVTAILPDDVGVGPGDVDFWDFAGETTGGTAITAQQSTDILADAIGMGEWTYTQGCAQCAGGPNTEPAVNIAANFGDCTDFVWAAVKHILSTSWMHQKISTRMFNNFNATKLASHGYMQVDSASVRDGDIVVRTSTSGCLCGHAGLFTGWAPGGYPIGHANNGSPATPSQPNRDGKTGKYHFKSTWGTVTKFFRPIV